MSYVRQPIAQTSEQNLGSTQIKPLEQHNRWWAELLEEEETWVRKIRCGRRRQYSWSVIQGQLWRNMPSLLHRYSGRPGPRSVFTFLGEPSWACNLYSVHVWWPDRQNQRFFSYKNHTTFAPTDHQPQTPDDNNLVTRIDIESSVQ